MSDFEYEITHVHCRRRSTKSCTNGKPLMESVYRYEADDTPEDVVRNYMSDGTFAEDGSIVCDSCYAGF